MTREKAIEVIKAYRDKLTNSASNQLDGDIEAFDMAIQALSQEPTFDDECQKDMDEAWEQIQKKRKRIPVTLDLTPCDDAISREAVKEIICAEFVDTQDGMSEWRNAVNDVVEEILHKVEQLPSVTQKSGKWIKVKSGDKDFPESIVCSRCSNENSHLDFNENAEPIGKVFVTSKFCPNCGARMEIDAMSEWIPVSERLPEENKQVIIQYRTRYREDVNLFDVTSRADYNYWQGIGREIDVIAWMPLPKPYEPQESEE